jgi:hypothetical protein
MKKGERENSICKQGSFRRSMRIPSASAATVASRHRPAEEKNEAEQGACPLSLDSLSAITGGDQGRRRRGSAELTSASRCQPLVEASVPLDGGVTKVHCWHFQPGVVDARPVLVLLHGFGPTTTW